MNVLGGPFAIGCVLLVVGGLAKAWRPGDTARALAVTGLPPARFLVRAGGAGEVLIGLGALATGDAWLVALVGLSYLGFAIFVALALRAGTPISSCGCFGKADTPPSVVHIVIDLAAAGTAIAVAAAGASVALPDVVSDQPLAGVPFALLVLIGSYLVVLSLSEFPKLLTQVRSVRDARG